MDQSRILHEAKEGDYIKLMVCVMGTYTLKIKEFAFALYYDQSNNQDRPESLEDLLKLQ